MTFQSFTPIEYLMIDIANNFGLDKISWDARIAWFKDNQNQLADLNKTAKEPALFYAGVQAYGKAIKGEAIGYPISLDATSSGAQILSLQVRCEKSALLCNVINSGCREDLYQNIFAEMSRRVGATFAINKDDVKQAIMTALYGSTDVPKRVFGEGALLITFYEVMEECAPGIWELNQSLLGLWQSSAYSHDWIMPDNFHVHIKVMDDHVEHFTFLGHGYEAHSKVNQPTKTGLSIGANTTHSIDGMIVREMSRRCSFDYHRKVEVMELCIEAPSHTADKEAEDSLYGSSNAKMVRTLLARYEASGFLSARIIDHIDSCTIHLLDTAQREAVWELLVSMPEKSFPVLAIHDCFRVHPNYANDLRRQYNQILHELASSEILKDMASQIVGEPVNVKSFDNFGTKVLEANYALS